MIHISSLCKISSQLKPIWQANKLLSLCQRSTLCCGNQAIIQHDNRRRKFNTSSQINHIAKTTGAEYLIEKKPSWFKALVKKLGWKFVYKGKFAMIGFDLYEVLIKDMDYIQFFKDFEMEDTFHSWFLIVELHVWMLSTRVMRDEEYGRVVRDSIINTMWSDVNERSQHMTVLTSTQTAQVQELGEEFRAALLNYDEGILGDDKVLAGAVWRRFFCKNCDDPLLIERMVHYIRHQMLILEKTSNKDLLMNKKLNLLPLPDVPIPH